MHSLLSLCCSDYGYQHANGISGECVRDKSIALDACTQGMKSQGYRKVAGDVCTGGLLAKFAQVACGGGGGGKYLGSFVGVIIPTHCRGANSGSGDPLGCSPRIGYGCGSCICSTFLLVIHHTARYVMTLCLYIPCSKAPRPRLGRSRVQFRNDSPSSRPLTSGEFRPTSTQTAWNYACPPHRY